MAHKKMIIKASGETEAFSKEKFQQSLRKAGASAEFIQKITTDVVKDSSLKTTHDIYQYAFNELRKSQPAIAARYNLKTALSKLGPQGYPFEKFVAEVFKEKGFSAQINHIAQGFCVSHEVDVLLEKEGSMYAVECKFHSAHIKVNVKIPLYIRARFEDIKKYHDKNGSSTEPRQAWIVTNAKFTSEAIAYGECVELKLIGWSYPDQENLAYIIDSLGLHPVTALTDLSGKQKQFLLKKGLVLCRDIEKRRSLLKEAGLNDENIEQIVQDAETICSLGAIP